MLSGFRVKLVDEMASNVGPAGIDIAYQRLGHRDAPLVLLIMGVRAQSIAWPDGLCHALVDQGLLSSGFDNRDGGDGTQPAAGIAASACRVHRGVRVAC